ncbi:VWA domain-containing protein [Candidatus Poribacteria bacterium]|nr:VWA domain-containing protein [Candidatus Poribacteria bacterium]
MSFRDPIWLALLLLLPLLLWLSDRHRKGIPSSLFYLSIPRTSWRSKAWRMRIYLRLLLLCMIVLALARPQSFPIMRKVKSKGGDIMLVVDISTSMLAEDFDGESRIEATKRVLREFIARHPNSRMGLILFARTAFPVCPLTYDHSALLRLIGRIRVGILKDGTAIGSALLSAAKRLAGFKSMGKAVILLTDGENNWGIDPIKAAETVSSLGIRVYAIGVGSPAGAPVPISHPIFGKSYARDETGKIIIAKLDEKTLRRIARITDGAYFRATDSQELNRAYEEITRMEKTRFERSTPIRRELFGYFLLTALLLLLLDVILFNLLIPKIP